MMDPPRVLQYVTELSDADIEELGLQPRENENQVVMYPHFRCQIDAYAQSRYDGAEDEGELVKRRAQGICNAIPAPLTLQDATGRRF